MNPNIPNEFTVAGHRVERVDFPAEYTEYHRYLGYCRDDDYVEQRAFKVERGMSYSDMDVVLEVVGDGCALHNRKISSFSTPIKKVVLYFQAAPQCVPSYSLPGRDLEGLVRYEVTAVDHHIQPSDIIEVCLTYFEKVDIPRRLIACINIGYLLRVGACETDGDGLRVDIVALEERSTILGTLTD